jgi:ketosteroid isomerase-like protein
MRLLRSILSCAVLLTCASISAQVQSAKPGDQLLGTWFGSFAVTNPDGKISHDTAVIVLERRGEQITGSAGATVDQQMAITDVRVGGDSIRFNVDAHGGIEFELHGTAAHLEGTATGQGMKAALDLKPAPGLLPHDELVKEISGADKAMFEAFGACDTERYKGFLSSDLEFYHDHVGKQDYAQHMQAMHDRCAEGIRLRREVVEGTLVVNAAPGFGAIEAGTHRFYSQQADGSEHLDATAQFTSVWSKTSGSWRLVRAVSYDHR